MPPRKRRATDADEETPPPLPGNKPVTGEETEELTAPRASDDDLLH